MINYDEITKLADKSTKMRQQCVFFGATNDQTGRKKRYRNVRHGFHPRALGPFALAIVPTDRPNLSRPKSQRCWVMLPYPHHQSPSFIIINWLVVTGTMEFGLTFHS